MEPDRISVRPRGRRPSPRRRRRTATCRRWRPCCRRPRRWQSRRSRRRRIGTSASTRDLGMAGRPLAVGGLLGRHVRLGHDPDYSLKARVARHVAFRRALPPAFEPIEVMLLRLRRNVTPEPAPERRPGGRTFREVGMGEVRFGPGEVVFHEGEPSRTVLLIEEGEVEVAKAAGAGEVLLGTVGPGEFVGEMGVIEGRPRSATVRARGRCGARCWSGGSSSSGSAATRGSPSGCCCASPSDCTRPTSGWPTRSPAPRTGRPRRRAGGRRAGRGGGPAGAVRGLRGPGRAGAGRGRRDRPPPVRGRPPAGGGRARPGGAVQLELEDAAPYRLSRRHFAVVAGAEGLAVRDDYSTLGTVVNGEAVGEQFPRSEASLRRGENLVVAGGAGSPFAFRLVVSARLASSDRSSAIISARPTIADH